MVLRLIFFLYLMVFGLILSATQMPSEAPPSSPKVSKLTTSKTQPVKKSILEKWIQKRLEKKWKKAKSPQMSYFNGLGLLSAILTISSSIAIFSGATGVLVGIGFIAGAILAVISLIQIARYKRRGIDIRPTLFSYLALLPILALLMFLGNVFG